MPQTSDPHNLHRFLKAQEDSYDKALAELTKGKKRSHWMWYIFPQVAGLGSSGMARSYAIRSRQEAVAFLQHEILGSRLKACASALLPHRGRDIHDIMGYPDDLKLRSSMTLFACISEPGSVFHHVLDAFYAGEPDEYTIRFLENNKDSENPQ